MPRTGSFQWAAIIEGQQNSTPEAGIRTVDGGRRILVTGASGFIGTHLSARLESLGHDVITLARDGRRGRTLSLDARSDREAWAEGLTGIDGIVHLAGIAHRSGELSEIEEINVRWPLSLFEAAVEAGVEDFVFLSSIKVLGDVSERPLAEGDAYAATDAYGRGKVLAEQGLKERKARAAAIQLAILRPPLVYGPGVKANFLSLIRWAKRGRNGLPLPLGAARAPRSLISVFNLCEAIVACMGKTGTFHCADPADTSVAELMARLGVPESRLVAVPPALMKAALTLLGRADVYQRLYEPLQVDSRWSRATLGWEPDRPDDRAWVCIEEGGRS